MGERSLHRPLWIRLGRWRHRLCGDRKVAPYGVHSAFGAPYRGFGASPPGLFSNLERDAVRIQLTLQN